MGKRGSQTAIDLIGKEEHRRTFAAFDMLPGRRQKTLAMPRNGRDGRIAFDGLLMNRLLTALPGEAFTRLLSFLEPVLIPAGQNVYEPGHEVDFVYFPETAVVSHIYTLADGSTTEAAIIGYEGMVGLPAILDTHAPACWTKVTIGGIANRISREALKREFRGRPAIQDVLLKYANILISQLSQRAVCNGSHQLDERLSTWLLMIHDRAYGQLLPLTHEQIANHLGARRAGITSSCNNLRAAGAIKYRRGQFRILRRGVLEEAACECYQALSTLPYRQMN